MRDRRPTEAQLLEWLGPRQLGAYHLLRKAGILREEEGTLAWSAEFSSADGTAFRIENVQYLIDDDEVRVF